MVGLKYVELSARTAFSFGDGAVTPEKLVSAAAQLGYESIGVTDAADLGGIVRARLEADRHGIKLIAGAEILVDGYPLTFLVKNKEGCQNLAALVTRSRVGDLSEWSPSENKRMRGRPEISWADVTDRSKGLYLLTGGAAGELSVALQHGNVTYARLLLERWMDVFKDSLSIEVQNHLTGGMERAVAGQLVRLSTEMGIPWVVTNAPRYVDDEGRLVHDVLLALRHKMTLGEAESAGIIPPNGMWSLRSPQEMRVIWDNAQGIEQSVRIAAQCNFEVQWLRPPLPEFRDVTDGKSCNDKLREQVFIGASKRWGVMNKDQETQLNHELEVIEGLDFSGFFLVMWDAVRYARDELGVLCQGRGSAANSAVAYCLEITAVDPVSNQLLFERFLSDIRVGHTEAPDIDLDIEHDQREQVLTYIYDKYGRERSAITCIVQTYGASNAVLDSMRALGYPPDIASQISKRVRRYSPRDGADVIEERLAEQFDLKLNNSRGQAFLKAMRGFDNLPRLRSTHVGGFVLSRSMLGDYLPVEFTSMGRTIIQFDKDDLDAIGVPKFDFLGLGALSMVRHAFNEIERRTGRKLEMYSLPADDPATFKMIQQGDTLGTFQIESRAQISSLLQTKPERMYDIVVQIALIRPGPIQGAFIQPYIARRSGREDIVYLHPRLEPILKRTQGIPVFQEQAMQLSSMLGGFCAAEADKLRRNMGSFKKRDKLAAVVEDLKHKMITNASLQPPVTMEVADRIAQDLMTFANYGFPESHAWSFALIAYATTYIKCHYPVEFYTGLLNAQPMGFYPVSTLIHDALKRGVTVIPPCVRDGDVMCKTVFDSDGSNPKLQVGLSFIRGVESETVERLVTLRRMASYSSIADLVQRLNLKKSEVLQLARSGALGVWESDRRVAAWEGLRAIGDRLPLAPTYKSTHRPRPLTRNERIYMDYYATGMCIDGHPVEHIRERLDKIGAITSRELTTGSHGSETIIGGLVTIRQRPESARGTIFLLLEDETGIFNVVVRPEVIERYREAVKFAPFVVVKGRLQRNGGAISVLAKQVKEIVVHHELIHPSRSFR